MIAEAPERFAVVDGKKVRNTFLAPHVMGQASTQERLGLRQEVEGFLRMVKHGGQVRTPIRGANTQ